MKTIHALPLLAAFLCAASAFAALPEPSQEEACSRLEQMLLDTQLAGPAALPGGYGALNESLKQSYRALCEGGQAAPLRHPNGQALYRDGRWFLPDGRVHLLNFVGLAAAQARILGPFLEAHNECAAGCGYVSWGIWGDEAHQQRRSCHNSGEAIDIHAIKCNGSTQKALSGRFDEYVDCMRGSLGVIYRSKNHFDHAHFQLQGCNMCQGYRCGG